MNYASFTNLPASTKFPAHSVDLGKAVPARVGRGRLAALLVLAAATEFLFVAVAAYFAAILYHRLILLDWPDPAKYLPESLLISTLDLLVSVGHRQYSRIQTQPRHVFLWSGASGVFLVFSFFLSTIFLLKISEDYSRATVMVQAANVCTDVGGGLGAQALSNGSPGPGGGDQVPYGPEWAAAPRPHPLHRQS